MFTHGSWPGNSVGVSNGVDVCGTSHSHEAPRREASGAGGTPEREAGREVLREKGTDKHRNESTSTNQS